MSISFNENGKNLSGYLVSPIDNSTEAIFSVGIGLLDRIGLWDTEALKPLVLLFPRLLWRSCTSEDKYPWNHGAPVLFNRWGWG